MDEAEKRELAESAIIATTMFLVESGYIKVDKGQQAQQAALAAAGFREKANAYDPFLYLKQRLA